MNTARTLIFSDALLALTAIVVGVLLVERVTILMLTRGPRGREWVRRTRLLHPNTISLIRIPMGLVAICFWLSEWRAVAIIWFSFWMITDLTDGTVARRCGLATETGKWLDPLSDKCMYFPTLIVLAVQGLLPMFWAVMLLLIDSVGQFSRLLIRKKAANYFGKAKTAFITIVLALVAVDQIEHLPFMSERFVYVLTASCALLAFLSFYCKVIPDLWYANSLTLANFLCGLAAIVNVVAGHHLRAFILVFVGQFFDLFDGRLAQKYGSTRFGAIYDDIADGTSFGLAIGFLVFSQLRDAGLPLLIASALGVLYFLCVVYRLYRFVHDGKSMPRGMFCGLPSPAGAMLAGSGVLLFGDYLSTLAGASVLLTAYLMISRIRYRHIGYRIWPALSNTVKLLGFVLFLVFVNMSIADKNYSGSFVLFCFTVAVLYAIYGIAYGSTEEDAVQSDASDEAEPPGSMVESAASSASR